MSIFGTNSDSPNVCPKSRLPKTIFYNYRSWVFKWKVESQKWKEKTVNFFPLFTFHFPLCTFYSETSETPELRGLAHRQPAVVRLRVRASERQTLRRADA